MIPSNRYSKRDYYRKPRLLIPIPLVVIELLVVRSVRQPFNNDNYSQIISLANVIEIEIPPYKYIALLSRTMFQTVRCFNTLNGKGHGTVNNPVNKTEL